MVTVYACSVPLSPGQMTVHLSPYGQTAEPGLWWWVNVLTFGGRPTVPSHVCIRLTIMECTLAGKPSAPLIRCRQPQTTLRMCE